MLFFHKSLRFCSFFFHFFFSLFFRQLNFYSIFSSLVILLSQVVFEPIQSSFYLLYFSIPGSIFFSFICLLRFSICCVIIFSFQCLNSCYKSLNVFIVASLKSLFAKSNIWTQSLFILTAFFFLPLIISHSFLEFFSLFVWISCSFWLKFVYFNLSQLYTVANLDYDFFCFTCLVLISKIYPFCHSH